MALRRSASIKLPAGASRVIVALVVGVSLSFLAPAVARGADEGADLKARTLFAAGEYKQAMDIYARLYAETLHPTYLRNIARCHQNLGDANRAISSFREYLRKARGLSSDQRAEIEGYIAEMERLKESQAAPVRPLPPRLVEPTPAAEPPASLAGATTVVVAAPASERETAPFYKRGWFWGGVAGVVVAGVVTAVLLGIDRSPQFNGDRDLFSDLRDRGR